MSHIHGLPKSGSIPLILRWVVQVLTVLVAGLVMLIALGACPAGSSEVSPPTASAPTATSTTMPPPTVAGTALTEVPAQPSATPLSIQGTAEPEPDALSVADDFPVPPDRDLFRLAMELLPGVGNVNPVVRESSPALEAGHRETFKLVDLESLELYESDFELRLVSPNAYWFVEEGVDTSPEDLERSALEFEELIYPKVTGTFGTEWKPGLDGDPHLYIMNANLRGVGGYFNAADEYPRQVQPVSNEHEAIYINVRYLPIGSEAYSTVLAHELQHAVHWNYDRTEETWVNEGLSELAVTVAGYEETSVQAFRLAGPASLTVWPAGDERKGPYYGSASLFMQYLTVHYGGRDNLRRLLSERADGIPGLNAYLLDSGYDVEFTDIFRDWAVANLLDEEYGPYGYPDIDFTVPVYGNLRVGAETSITTPQYGNDYIRLEQMTMPVNLFFDGEATVSLLPVDVDDGCWWSNKGDVIDTTLTAPVDLRGIGDAYLEYRVWFSIEEGWDFAYLEVSEDNGETWSILETALTSSDDPLDVSFGPGYTGKSEGWRDEMVSLEPWIGKEFLVRFQYVTDAAIHDHGMCLRNLNVSVDDTTLPAEWTPSGFVWTNNLVRQSYIVQLVYEGIGASENRVVELVVDSANQGQIGIDPSSGARRVVAVVQPMAPATRMEATYTLSLELAE